MRLQELGVSPSAKWLEVSAKMKEDQVFMHTEPLEQIT
jgi:hypothetical protein